MTEDVIKKLPKILRNHISTLKRVSYDNENHIYMFESQIKVVHFDKIPKEYAKIKGCPMIPASNDALYISADGEWYFIEFKNGSVDKANLYQKIYDSHIILIELGLVPDFDYIRENIHYILVYNSGKYSRVQKSEARGDNFNYFMKLAKEEERLFGIEKFEGYLFKKAHTYEKDLFEQTFIIPTEEREKDGDL